MNNTNYNLTIVHLYPREMNIYGDMGNIITLKQRASWRGIKVTVKQIGKGEKAILQSGDIYFMGGGQDNDMYSVFDDLLAYKQEFIKKETTAGKPFLLVCGAFQLFGDFFLDAQGRDIKGLGIIPIQTKAPGDQLADRCLGNIVTGITPELRNKLVGIYNGKLENTIVGFENHGGQTYFTENSIKPIGNVQFGKGNNAKQKIEGAVFGNIYGTYTHGSLLPKNPHIADLLLHLALSKKYGKKIYLAPLDDEIEWKAHTAAKKRVLGG